MELFCALPKAAVRQANVMRTMRMRLKVLLIDGARFAQN